MPVAPSSPLEFRFALPDHLAIMPKPGRAATATASAGLLGSPSRNLTIGMAYMLVVMVLATAAYTAAGWSFADALYMVVITVYTVGYNEVHPVETPLLRGITISTIVLGCTGVIFLTGALVQFITLNQLNQVFGVRRMSGLIDKLNGHVILCGFGRMGVEMAQGLSAGGAKFVVLERDSARVAQARALGYLAIEADATDETVLKAAGITRARTLATVLSVDAANVFITLSARSLNPGMEIIARGEVPTTESKLLQAGANKVVLPTHIGAERMVEMILYKDATPIIPDTEKMRAFENALLSLGLSIEMVTVAPESPADGQTVEWVEREGAGAFFVVQINYPDSETVTRPDAQTPLMAGDGVVLVGRSVRALALFEAGGRSSFRKSAR
jgi:voltage-gated potassium channel Kch